MKHFKTKILHLSLIAAIMIGFVDQLCAQQRPPRKRTFGLSASVQGGQSTINLPIWVSPNMVIAPALAFTTVENVGSTINAGGMLKLYTSGGRITPFFGGQFFLNMVSPTGGSSTTNFAVAGVFGSEYYLHYMFSLGVQAMVIATLPSDTQSFSLSTASGVTANIYF